ncbi:hypothetical protein [Nannocystis bainbridge]|uniref:Lipoprotein n=1 Tax=Nannocystis bainbridge TaxID=2995303 RepID=A0ABT5DRA3_9BACT|nr:hypothetical protein [Nannocystis bainbridge]MDC0716076.1 hypothetical protein [Nannocystis bainbridge]
MPQTFLPRRFRYAAALALSLACDSGYSLQIVIEIPDDIVARYDEEQRGVLYVEVRPQGFDPVYRAAAVVCGETTTYRLDNYGDGEVPNTGILAWIEPVTGGGECGPNADTQWMTSEGKKVYPDAEEPQAEAMIQETSSCNHSEDVELVIDDLE